MLLQLGRAKYFHRGIGMDLRVIELEKNSLEDKLTCLKEEQKKAGRSEFSRALSVAITHLETAILWLEHTLNLAMNEDA